MMKVIVKFFILTITLFACWSLRAYASDQHMNIEMNIDNNSSAYAYQIALQPQILRRAPSRSLIAPGNRNDLKDPPLPLRRSPSQSFIAPGNRSDLSTPPPPLRRSPDNSLIAPGNR